MKVSIIIPTLNAQSCLSRLLNKISSQSYQHSELIIIDSSSSDETLAIARKYTRNIIVISRSDFNHGKTRSQAAQTASGEILVYLTQDAIPANNSFLINLIKPILTNSQIVATSARQIPSDNASPLDAFARNYNYPPISNIRNFDDIKHLGIQAFFFSNVASAIRKDVFDNLGGFPKNVIMNEDMLFCAKLLDEGYSVAYVAEATVIHSHNYTATQIFNRYFDIGVVLGEKHGILRNTGSAGEGVNFIYKEWQYLISQHQWKWIAPFILEIISKTLAFYLGKNHRFLPCKLKKKISMHSYYWKC